MSVAPSPLSSLALTKEPPRARFDMKYTTDPPQVFVRATKEELIQHCSTEHHDAWEALRRNV